ncbi:MAG: hypothetical protein V7603_4998 [Micromonosporaceae bacterium]
MLCADLRLLWTQAGGPSLRALGNQLQLSKSQVGAILNGHIRRLPDWQAVGGLVEGVYRYAVDHNRADRLSLRAGVDEYWRPRYMMLEHTFSRPRSTTGPPGVSSAVEDPAEGQARSRHARSTSPPAPTPALLPTAVAGFAGRISALKALDALLDADAHTGPAVLITAIDGTAGVGKTALAVHWAHGVAGQFPDGQLYVNLRGFDRRGSMLDPCEALRGFLDALGVPAERIPAGLHAQVGLYRSVLAGKRVLLVLDNARDVEQVRPLLPGTPGCLAIVTSRNQLAPLVAIEGAYPLTLDLLSPAEARDLLVRRLGTERVMAEPDAVEEIIAGCARLPLALAVAAARAATHPDFLLARLAAELRDAHHGLDALDAGDPGTDLRAVLSWSYVQLSARTGRLFRLLGLHPGPDVTAVAAASIAAMQVMEVRPLLSELVRSNLILEHRPGRYTYHDLLRAYATEQSQAIDGDEHRATTVRMLDHYLHAAHAAGLLLNPRLRGIDVAPPQIGVTVERFDSYKDALTWYTAEHPVVLAVNELAAAAGFDTHTWQLARAFRIRPHRLGNWAAQLTIQRNALDAARRLDNHVGEAQSLIGLAHAYDDSDQLEEADTHCRLALDLYVRLGDPTGEAYVHMRMAALANRQARPADGLPHAQQALELYRTAGDRVGHANAYNQLSWGHAQLGDYRQALAYGQKALRLFGDLSDGNGEAATWDSLGYAHRGLAQYERATRCYHRALRLYRDLDHPYDEAETLTSLGETLAEAGNHNAAQKAWERAQSILSLSAQ